MARSIYITSAEGNSGKSTIALGVIDRLSREVERVGVFRPISRSTQDRDYVLEMMLAHDSVDTARDSPHRLDYDMCVGVSYDDVHADADAALSRIVERFKAVEALSDVMVILGSDYTDVGSPTELSYNARIAANLGAPVLLVLGGRVGPGRGQQLGQADARSADDLRQFTELAMAELIHAHATLLAVIVNRADPSQLTEIVRDVSSATPADEASADTSHDASPRPAAESNAATPARTSPGSRARRFPVWAIPEDRILVAPSMGTLLDAVDGTLVAGDPALLEREAVEVVVAGMSMVNVLPRLLEGAVVIVAADRTEVLLAVLMAEQAGTFPSTSGIILNGGFELPEPILRLMTGLNLPLPVIATELGTYATSMQVTHARGRLAADSVRKYSRALDLFRMHVDGRALVENVNLSRSDVVTPLMFEYGLLQRAKSDRKHIVLPEGEDDRILHATHTLLRRGVAAITLLGDEGEIRARAIELGLDISDAAVVSTLDATLHEKFAEEYRQLRAHKGITIEQARSTVADSSYFGTMMVHLGLADGMVSGAAHTTAHTIRPGFEIIKTQPGVSVVSSVFLMALADRVLAYGDCAVIPDPTAQELADIAISSAATATQFGIEARIAMLSYSTGASGSGADVEKVRTATALVRERRPDLPIDGPIQYDAAADAAVAAAKIPESTVAGRATVFIFPDLNTGNNTYKAVQRSAGAVAIGPVLQGLRKPINDLSRGALVQDIVNTVAITAIQAGGTS